MRTVCRLLVAAGIVLASAPAWGDRAAAFAVGVLRRDGVIVPFAVFDGKHWSNSWPPPALEVTVPVNVRSVPRRWWGATGPLEVWQAPRVSADEAPRALRVLQPDWVDVHCVRQIGLRTDYHTIEELPPPAVQPYPKDGLVVSPTHAVEPIAIAPPDGADAQVVTPALVEAFNRAERDVADRYGHPIARRSREGLAPTIEAIYSYGDEPRVYYVEAIRQYRQLGQHPGTCTAMALSTGWFTRRGAEVRALVNAVDLLSCERTGASYMLPLGVIRDGPRLFWLAQFSGADQERFVVAEVKEKTVDAVLSVWGGSCP